MEKALNEKVENMEFMSKREMNDLESKGFYYESAKFLVDRFRWVNWENIRSYITPIREYEGDAQIDIQSPDKIIDGNEVSGFMVNKYGVIIMECLDEDENYIYYYIN